MHYDATMPPLTPALLSLITPRYACHYAAPSLRRASHAFIEFSCCLPLPPAAYAAGHAAAMFEIIDAAADMPKSLLILRLRRRFSFTFFFFLSQL